MASLIEKRSRASEQMRGKKSEDEYGGPQRLFFHLHSSSKYENKVAFYVPKNTNPFIYRFFNINFNNFFLNVLLFCKNRCLFSQKHNSFSLL